MVAVGCSDDDRPADPTTKWRWKSLGTGMSGQGVYALTVYENRLIAGGLSDSAGGVSADNIATWDGSSWKSFGSGTNHIVRTVTSYDNKVRQDGGRVEKP
jgi:hypothetical protein